MTDCTEKLVELTRDLILIPSTAANPNERDRCFEFVKNHIECLESIHLHEYRKNGIPSLVALPDIRQTPKILLCAHLDVISHPDQSCYRSHIVDGRIYGPGAGDMKGALAILLELFRDFHSRHRGASLGLVVTADEETGGRFGVQYLVDEIELRCDVALIPDGGSLNEIIVEEKGIIHLRVCSHGRAAHAARPWLGVNPLQRLIDRLARLRNHFDSLRQENGTWYPTCTVTVMDTPNKTINRIPMIAECQLDIRFPPPHTTDSIMTRIREILGKDIEYKPLISAEPTHQSPDPLFLSIAEEINGEEPTLSRADAGSDARFFSRLGIPAIISSPVVGNLHSENEWIDIQSMEAFYRIYERYILAKLNL